MLFAQVNSAGFDCGVEARKQETNQNADDRDHHQYETITRRAPLPLLVSILQFVANEKLFFSQISTLELTLLWQGVTA